jgi:glycosyltransferase involved in cell wall biosynthesis
LFCPSYTIPFGYRGKAVVTMHDAAQELYADSFSWWSRLRFAPLYRYSAIHADAVITDSHASKRDLVTCYRLPEDRVKVIYLAPDEIFRPLRDPRPLSMIRKKYLGDDRPFILYVGKLSTRRNIPTLISAFGQLKQQHRMPHKLLLVGLNYRKIDVTGLAEDCGMACDVAHVDYISDEDLVLLYNAADLFVFPSSYEGFSLPILEAMVCGVPVVTVNSSALREIAQDAAYLVDAPRADALAHALYQVITEDSLRNDLVGRGLARVASFSWEATAQATLSVLEQVAER